MVKDTFWEEDIRFPNEITTFYLRKFLYAGQRMYFFPPVLSTTKFYLRTWLTKISNKIMIYLLSSLCVVLEFKMSKDTRDWLV